jgi:hypothetical protein
MSECPGRAVFGIGGPVMSAWEAVWYAGLFSGEEGATKNMDAPVADFKIDPGALAGFEFETIGNCPRAN